MLSMQFPHLEVMVGKMEEKLEKYSLKKR